MNKIKIRRLTAQDIGAAAAIEARCLQEAWSECAYRSAFRMDGENSWFWGAEREGELVGVIGLFRMGEDGEIGNVAVVPEHRRHGIASKLLETALEEGERKLAMPSFTLEVRDGNLPALKLYESHGFRTEGMRPHFYQNPTEDARIMWRRGDNGI
jgi:ribosomal-protein-alanine acetyltransferase